MYDSHKKNIKKTCQSMEFTTANDRELSHNF